MLRPGDRVGVAASGGADSTALLFTLLDLAATLDIAVSLVHFNHQLRGEDSDADQRFVEALARRFELRCLTASADLSALAKSRGSNLEELGRESRYRWFGELVRERKLDKIAVGHTRDDQAETVLFHLLRGSGTAGLAGVRAKLEGGVIRPLIDVGREQARAYLRSRGEDWREDASNQDLAFSRNRIRAELLPALTRDWNPNIVETLARTAEIAADEEDYWTREIEERGSELRLEDGALTFNASWLRQEHPALARRLLREAARRLRGNLRGLGAGHINSVLELARRDAGDGQAELPGLVAERSFDQVRLAAPDKSREVAGTSQAVLKPGIFPAPVGRGRIRVDVTGEADPSAGYNNGVRGLLDWEKTPRPLELRSWRSGDRLRPRGFRRSQKLAKLFQEARVASWDRPGWPVIAVAQEGEQTLVWARGFGVSADFEADERSRSWASVSDVDVQGREFSGIKLRPESVYDSDAVVAEGPAREETKQ